MICHELREFVDRVMEKRAIDDEDVKLLQRETLKDCPMSRHVVDVLVALDRAAPETCDLFADVLVALVVDYAVWENRPTGMIDAEKAHWLMTTLCAGNGPTETARRIAFEIVREAQRCDEALLSFAFSKGAAKSRGFDAGRVLLAS